MISAISDSCSVKWAEVNRQVYKFQSLVFKEDEQPAAASNDLAHAPKPVPPPLSPDASPNDGAERPNADCDPDLSQTQTDLPPDAPTNSSQCPQEPPKSILTNTQLEDSPKLGPILEENLDTSHVSTKRSREPTEMDSACVRRSPRRVRFSEDVEDEKQEEEEEEEEEGDEKEDVFQSMRLSLVPDETSRQVCYQELMEKSKEELVDMVVTLHLSLAKQTEQLQNADGTTQIVEEDSKLKPREKNGKLKKHKSHSKSPRKKRLISL